MRILANLAILDGSIHFNKLSIPQVTNAVAGKHSDPSQGIRVSPKRGLEP